MRDNFCGFHVALLHAKPFVPSSENESTLEIANLE